MESMTSIKKLHEKPKFAAAILARLREFCNSYIFYIFLTVLACTISYTRNEVKGVILFIAIICALLLICEDVMPLALPILLVCTFSTSCYDSFDLFIGYVVYVPIAVACLLFHFVVYRKKFSVGPSIWGIFAVSIAICLGGLGRFTTMEYLMGGYYVFGLSFGMLAGYMLLKAEFSAPRSYDIKIRFSAIMTLVGLLCLFMILAGRYQVWKGNKFAYYRYGVSPNNIATMLMFAMPFPLYLAKKKGFFWAILTPLIFSGLCLNTSRGGLLFGTVEFIVCCLYWTCQGKTKWGITIRFIICLFVAATIVFIVGDQLWDLIFRRFIQEELDGSERHVMIFQSFENFRENPFVGTGLLDDSIAYGRTNKQGTMAWYHMMIPQVIGSMGLVGILAYGYQALTRFKLIFKKCSWWSLCLGISYLGILLMSQVNPGEFCPMPFELLTVFLFILQERRFERHALWEKRI